jgi:membrane protein implicated in regulation of membrane protease activity
MNNMPNELIWLLAGLALMLMELATPGFVLFFFGLGALVAAVWAWTGAGALTSQLVVFLVSSILFLVFLRKYATNLFKGGKSQTGKVPSDDTLGKRVLVVEEIDPAHLKGKVELNGTQWNATADVAIRKGTQVEITGRKGLTLTVKILES